MVKTAAGNMKRAKAQITAALHNNYEISPEACEEIKRNTHLNHKQFKGLVAHTKSEGGKPAARVAEKRDGKGRFTAASPAEKWAAITDTHPGLLTPEMVMPPSRRHIECAVVVTQLAYCLLTPQL